MPCCTAWTGQSPTEAFGDFPGRIPPSRIRLENVGGTRVNDASARLEGKSGCAFAHLYDARRSIKKSVNVRAILPRPSASASAALPIPFPRFNHFVQPLTPRPSSFFSCNLPNFFGICTSVPCISTPSIPYANTQDTSTTETHLSV